MYFSVIFIYILNDINIACYTDDNTFYKSCGNVDAIVKNLRISAEKLFKRLKHNIGKDNTYKCHLILNTEHSSHYFHIEHRLQSLKGRFSRTEFMN